MLNQLWHASRPLTTTAAIMVVVLGGALAGLALDERLITGVPAWLKPAKFAASIAIYTATLAWIFSLLPAWRRMRAIVGWTTAVLLTLEIVIIGTQAWRGTTSHFNVSTPLDIALFAIMGTAIVAQTLAAVAVAVALWRERLGDAALGWALRFAVVISILGASTGGLMTQPTAAQLEAARHRRMTVAGAHTVGAADGGPGLPGTGWSTDHGDLRVPHFVGLHALQVLPLIALLLRRRVGDATRVRLTFVAAASYLTLFAILLAQALRGVSIVAPDASTSILLASWAVATALAAVAVESFRSSHRPIASFTAPPVKRR